MVQQEVILELMVVQVVDGVVHQVDLELLEVVIHLQQLQLKVMMQGDPQVLFLRLLVFVQE